MSIIESKTEQELAEEFEQLDEMIEEEDKKLRKKTFVGWLTSASVHLLVLLIFATIAFSSMKKQEEELPPMRVATLEIPKDKPKPEKQDIIKDPINIVVNDHEVTSNATVVSDNPEVIKEVSSEDVVASTDPKGREEALSDSEMGNTGFLSVIGPGGGSKGMFGKRIGGGDKRTIGRAFGPHAQSVKSGMDAALRWLKKHQSPNGMWSAKDYYLNCTDGQKCEPGQSVPGADEAMTGYAILCFLGAGYDHNSPSAFRTTVRKGLEYLISIQKPDGLIGARNYEHPVAAMALAEAFAMTGDIALRDPAQKAIDVIVARQNIDSKAVDKAYAGLGWDYVKPNPTRNDTSVSCWNIFALKSAKAGGLNVGNSMVGAKKWLECAWKTANPNWEKLSDPYKDVSVFPYVWNTVDNTTQRDHLSFAGACSAVFLGHTNGDILLETLVNDMDKRWLDTGNWKNNAYCIYYASLTAFQVGGDHWKKWRDAYVPHLINTQIKEDGCKQGTWEYQPQTFHGWDTSRILIHCYYTLSYEVAIRYDIVNKK